MFHNLVGDLVKNHRSKEGWSQEHFAAISGIAPRTLQRIENGERVNTETLRAIAAFLKMDVAELLPLNEPIEAEVSAEIRKQLQQHVQQIEKELNTLPRMLNGKELLTVVSSFSILNTDYPPPASKDEGMAIAALLEMVKDYGDLHRELTPTQEMDLVFETDQLLHTVEALGFIVFAGKLKGSVVFPGPDKNTEPLRMQYGAVFICRSTEIKTFRDPNNSNRESARFQVPFGPVNFSC